MPRKITPMKMHNFYCSDELYTVMQQAAVKLNESDSEYIRRAVEMRNAQYQQKPCSEEGGKFMDELKQTLTKPTIPELKEMVKEMERSKMVQSFQK